jgi:hypothetical protein
MSNVDFLSKLQAEAKLQARLHQQRVLPTQVDWLTSLVGNYPWQFLIVLSGLVALFIKVQQYV